MVLWKVAKKVLRIIFPKWILDDVEARFCHPYWRKQEVQLSTPSCRIETIEGKKEKTSSRPPFKRINRDQVLETLKNKNASKILDVGCGQGNLVRHLEDLGFEVFGVTINSEEVKAAKHKNIFLIDIQSDLTKTPLANMQFDAILSFDCLEHLSSPMAGLKNINSLLKPGGLFIAYLPPSRWTECDYHIICYTPRQFRWMLNLEGFILDKVEGRHFCSNKGNTYYATKKYEGRHVYPGVLD